MNVIDLNWLAVALATAVSMLVGLLWYAQPVFGSYWMKVSGVDPESTKSGVVPIVVTFLLAGMTATALAVGAWMTSALFGGSFIVAAILTALALWVVAGARMVTHAVFEDRPAGLLFLNLAHELVTFLAMALIVGLWIPDGLA